MVLAGLLLPSPARAQELEPRAYSPAPIGTHFFVVGYANQSGDVSVDPDVSLKNVSAHLNLISLGYGNTYALAGRQSNLSLAAPFVFGDVRALVGNQYRTANRSAVGDVRLRFWMGLIGTPALTPRQFAARKRGLALGTSLTLVVPTGQYDSKRLINVGSNRWSVKPEFGLSYPTGRWTLESAAGVWLFGTNHDYFGGARLEQDPLGTFQAHVEYTFRPGLWLGASGTFVVGGTTLLNGEEQDTFQKNTRYGLTLSVPLKKGQSTKLAWAKGFATRRGGNFTTIAVAWQHVWF